MVACKLRMKKVRGLWEITTYASQARGARRRIKTIKIQPNDLERTLSDPAVLIDLGAKNKAQPRT